MKRTGPSAILLLLLLVMGIFAACGGGGEGPTPPPPDDNVLINDLDGTADIAVDSAFEYDFGQAIDAATVTSQTFFLIEAGEAEASVSKRPIDPALCDPALSIAAAVSCLTTTSCQLAPAANLNTYRCYLVCLGTGILYGNGNPFEGFMASFTTAGTPPTFTVGGQVAGLVGTGLVLQDNGGDDLAVSADGAFQFATALLNNAAYAVTVRAQPSSPAQTCTINSGSGTIPHANVTDVSVICSTDSHSVGGTISGLDGTGLILQDNGGDDLAITADGTFLFASKVASGASYAVTVKTQPTDLSQTCVVTNGNGTITNADITNVGVTCTTNTFSVGGAVSGLEGTVVLQNVWNETHQTEELSLDANGAFAFTLKVDDGGSYTVTVKTQPSTQVCVVTHGSGTVDAGDVTDVEVDCSYEAVIFSTTSASHSGNLGGIRGADAICTGDANRPDSRAYKAMVVDGTSRIACSTASCSGGPAEHVDWVFSASTTYYRPGLAVTIGTTTANGIFSFPLDNAFVADSSLIWTGLNSNWTTGNHCGSWTSGDWGSAGDYGASGSPISSVIYSATDTCHVGYGNLICVSQE